MTDSSALRVLLIDDEIEFANTLAERLELRGYNACVAENGTAGLAMLDKQPFDIVLLDMMLPGMTGNDVLTKIRSRWHHMPVVLVTGKANAKDGIQGMKDGANAYLMKPIDLDELLEIMRSLHQGACHA